MDIALSKILVVEDNPGDAYLIKDSLQKIGINPNNIFLKHSIGDSLEKLQQGNIDLILLDLGLPDCEKEETVNIMIKNVENIPIIVLTGLDDEFFEVDTMVKGVQDYLVKGKYDTYTLNRSIKYALLRFEHERKIKELSEFKSKLFRIVSHDLKGPMGSLYQYIKMCLEDFETLTKESIKDDLTALEDISKSLLNLVENLFNWARIQVGEIETKPEEINIYKLVEENIQISKLQAFSKQIEIRNNISKDICAFADSDMIKTIIRNLIFNAIKFTNLNGIIEISGQRNNGFTEVSVSDNGIGIEQDDLNKIFCNCNNLIKQGTNNEKGSGLGLALCKEFVEQNNGKIWVNSEFRIGTTFTFSLPSGSINKI